MKTLEDFKKEAFKRKDVRKAYRESEAEFQVIRAKAISHAKKHALALGLELIVR